MNQWIHLNLLSLLRTGFLETTWPKRNLEWTCLYYIVMHRRCQMRGDQMPPTGLGQQRGHHFKVTPVEFNFSWSEDKEVPFGLLEEIFVQVCYKMFSVKQDYSNYNYIEIMVKASISLDVSATNIVLKNPATQVLPSPFKLQHRFYEQWYLHTVCFL